ncbi:mitochondrial thiamine pyrophosphate carrier-like [Xenia sp. Carnegie-2017]|uniref:mitochondrial thiamine pyrophosphate carrier-like n=1 Tax=Xenia sp. Carnegie-2017 TaxID=2897299 RepID=UPI001F03EF08|nr:mitochondrial thiamine pyrophosphate carrier-like [Xenia sp. Carnegie-2017]
MVGYDDQLKELSPTQYALAGAVSGITTRLLLQPLDVVKIRLQLQVDPLKQIRSEQYRRKYRGLLQSLSRIASEEGLLALWKGHIPAQLLSVSYGCVQFMSFEVLTKLAYQIISPEKYLDQKPITHFICGGLSGCCSSVVVQPIDVLRTRLVAQGEPKVYVSLLHAVREMFNENGIRTFYKGLLPTMLEIFPQTGMHFAFYTGLQMIWNNHMKSLVDGNISVSESLFCGAMSGILSKIIIHPLDVVKKRLQVEGFAIKEVAIPGPNDNMKSPSMLNCIWNILKKEGMRGFYKGLKVNIIKGASSAGLSFMSYEQCCKYLMNY